MMYYKYSSFYQEIMGTYLFYLKLIINILSEYGIGA
jgi:hypothetical protein